MEKRGVLLRKKPATLYIAEMVVESVYGQYGQVDENIGAVRAEI